MANSLISMVKGDSTLINNTEVLNGQILFDETKQKIFLDDNAKRKEYGGSDDNAVKKDDVAYVESAMVATRGYSAGNYIIVQDTLYKATTQINSGTALVVGTNVSTTTVGNELTQINNDLVNSNNRITSIETELSITDITTEVASGNKLFQDWHFRKHGDTVQVEINGFKNLVSQSANTIVNGIPEILRPTRNLNFSIEFLGESYRFIILTNGTLSCYPYNTVAQQNNISTTITYIV